MTYKLILLRHGESEWNAKNLFTGWVDVDLNEKGLGEAERGGLQRHHQAAEQDREDRDSEVEVRARVPPDTEQHQPRALACATPTLRATKRSSQRMPVTRIMASTK